VVGQYGGTFTGIVADATSGSTTGGQSGVIYGTNPRGVTLNISNETAAGGLNGTLAIGGVGNFNFDGYAAGTAVTLVLYDTSSGNSTAGAGTLIGTLSDGTVDLDGNLLSLDNGGKATGSVTLAFVTVTTPTSTGAASGTITGTPATTGSNPSIVETFTGTFTGNVLDQLTGSAVGGTGGVVYGTDARTATINITGQSTNGALAGTLDIAGVGHFPVTGFINTGNLTFEVGDTTAMTPAGDSAGNGLFTATLSTNNSLITGPISALVGAASVSGRMSLSSNSQTGGTGGTGFTPNPNNILRTTDTIFAADGAANTAFLDNGTIADVFSTHAGTETLTVTPGVGPTIVTGIALSNANDSTSPGTADPQSFLVEGSNNGTTFTVITPTAVSIPPYTAEGQTQTFTFVNATSYTTYRIILTSSDPNLLELSQLQLIGTLTPTPTPTPAPIVYGTGPVNTGPPGGTGAAPTTAVNTSSGPTLAGVTPGS